MSKFFDDDTCIFKADSAIIGTIERTWSDVEFSSFDSLDCYIHKDLPLKVGRGWLDDKKLPPGYVIITFGQDLNGYCLVAEDSLQLIDRAFVAGDVIKKRLSDQQSGTVLNTSLICSLQPLCSANDFMRRQYPPSQRHTPSHGPHAPKRAKRRASTPDRKLVHGFPSLDNSESNALAPLNTIVPPLLRVPASELKISDDYREGDTLIYKGWIGQVTTVYDEVTVRLSNGSVVVVENAQELEEPFWIPGTSSYELVQRLDRAGYYQYHPQDCDRTKQLIPAEPCYPGQHVQTKKGNLRCGRWKFGAYDPTIVPKGIVVEVRTVNIKVRWVCPITSHGPTPISPLALLAPEELEIGEVIVYDRNKVPKKPIVNTFANASFSPDTGFGHRVRFKDPSGAAAKYGPPSAAAASKSTPVFNRIPRAATQGFDMNVLQIVATATQVTVRWQDCSITEEDSTQLFPYFEPDQHEVWPGEIVSFIPDEEKLGDEAPIIRLHKVGVVQSVDARERIARIRWFEGTEVDIDEERKASKFSGYKYGKLRGDILEVPLYDIAAHPALAITRGYIVRIRQKQMMSPISVNGGDDIGRSGPIDPDPGCDIPYTPSASSPPSRVAQLSSTLNAGFVTGSIQRARTFLGLAGDDPNSRTRDSSLLQDMEWVGEIVDLCLDGDVIVRLGATSEVREVKVPAEHVKTVPLSYSDSSEYSDDEAEDEDSFFSDAMSLNDEKTDSEIDKESVGAIDVSMEYEGGEKLNDDDNDDEMWITDDEDVEGVNMPKSKDIDDRLDSYSCPVDGPPNNEVGPVSISGHSSTLPSFSVLEAEAPSDHHFFGSIGAHSFGFMYRIMREHKIMQSSLPDGIYVRTWESRLDLMRVLIVGPFDTPYEYAPFVVDLHFGLKFPTSPPDAYFHSWTGGLGRINPNLYEDGKICLSLLGTWDADERHEAWSLHRSTVLQILVSLMGLVLVKEPYYSRSSPINSSKTLA